MQLPVTRIFVTEAGRMAVGTYAPHDPTTADIADLVARASDVPFRPPGG